MKIRYDWENIRLEKGLSGEMFGRRSLHGRIVQSGNCPVGKIPVRKMSVGDLSSRKCQSGNSPLKKLSYNRTDKYSQQSSVIWQVWINAWVFFYILSGLGFQFRCSHLNFKYRVYIKPSIPWHSHNYRVCIHS